MIPLPNQRLSTGKHQSNQEKIKLETYYTLLALLREKGVRQSELANVLGYDRAYINRIIKGSQQPSVELKIKISKFFGVDSWTIWRGVS